MNRKRSHYVFVTVLGIVLIVLLRPSLSLLAQSESWSEPINISHAPDNSWFPDIAVDSQENVHVIWCETAPQKRGGELERVFYSVWNGREWSEPNDIVPEDLNIVRNAIAVDRSDVLHLAFRYPNLAGGLGIYYKQAAASAAWSARAWSSPRLVNAKGHSYAPDLHVDDQNVFHLIFDDRGDPKSEVCPGCADIYYRRSTDLGHTWSAPINLSQSPTGSSRPQMEIDPANVIHVAWDEGWDRLSGLGEPFSGAYTFSEDGGRTWAPVLSITYPITQVAQLTAGGDGRGGVLLVWRATSRDEIFYQWSADGGRSWGTPSAIPGVFARPWADPFDMYDMAADSAGHIHLVVVGRQIPDGDAPLGVYSLEWDGEGWSSAVKIYGRLDFPEYPKIAVSRGNQLHIVWFVRETLWADENAGPYQVWYSRGQSAAPQQIVTPIPTSTPVPPTPTPAPTPTAMPSPAVSFEGAGLPNGLYTETDDVLRLSIALSPIILLIVAVVAVRLSRPGGLRR